MSVLLSGFSVWLSRNPYQLTACVTYSVLFPLSMTIFAVATHRHRRHPTAAVRAIVRDTSCICTLTTPVSGERHPHPTVSTLRSICFIYSPFSHCHPPFHRICHSSFVFQPLSRPAYLFSDCRISGIVIFTRPPQIPAGRFALEVCRPPSTSGKHQRLYRPFW